LLAELSQQFRAHGFDLRQLMRWLALSEPHALSSRIHRGNESDMPENGESPKFSRYYARQITAEQLYESLLVVAGAPRSSPDDHQAAKAAWLRQFISAIENDEAEETSTFNGTIAQTLMMFNGELTERAIALDRENLLTRVLASNSKPAAKMEQLFLAALARKPDARERNLASRLITAKMTSLDISATDADAGARQPGAQAMQDLYWALLNSNEFILNH
jgi:hypothetical protein